MFRLIEDHKDFLLINKDPGVGFHKEAGFQGLPAAVREKLGLNEIFPVHRLDKMTSGLLLFAKNKGAAKDLSRQFAEGLVEKRYLGISDRRPKKKQGWVQGDMVRSRRGSWKILRTKNNPAKTRFVSTSIGEGFRLYLLKPYTGKTHQLRVALKSIGAPAFGDLLYHPNEYSCKQPDRGYLHSFSITFNLADSKFKYTCQPDRGELFSESLAGVTGKLLRLLT